VYAAGGLGQAVQQLQPAAHATPRGDERSVEQPALDADASSLSGTDVNPELIVLTRRKANTSAWTAAPDAAAVPPTALPTPSRAQE